MMQVAACVMEATMHGAGRDLGNSQYKLVVGTEICSVLI